MWQFIGTIAGVVIGGLITWLVAWLYYKKAGDELKTETGRIRKLNNLICRGLEQAKLAEFGRDKDGEISGIYVNLKVSGGGKSGESATTAVDRKPEAPETSA